MRYREADRIAVWTEAERAGLTSPSDLGRLAVAYRNLALAVEAALDRMPRELAVKTPAGVKAAKDVARFLWLIGKGFDTKARQISGKGRYGRPEIHGQLYPGRE